MIGRTLGHYEIIEPLGAGGMGEVYRAHDTTLKRDVAIKVLPEDLSADVERLARLEREAWLLAALNHPNIATIYGLEEVEAEDGTSVRYLVLELIEGESLAEKLSRGRIAVDKALGIARQIAEALEAAHAKGIIHRDLKPGNVVITPEGQAKVLDFGLAKSHEVEGTSPEISPDLTESPTVAAATRAGIILGTAAYMSPEQARGKPLDKRTDIWSFGCVLYEMLAGRRPFEGETVTDILAAIVEREPDWSAIPSAAPPIIQLLLRRCLEKDPYRRLHDVADARIEIVNAISEPEAGLPGVAPVVAGQPPLWRRALPWGTGVAVGAMIAGFAVWSLTHPAPPAPQVPIRFSIELPPDVRFTGTTRHAVAISPDRSHLVFSANDQLYVRAMDDPLAVPLQGTEGGARSPFISPDGQWVGFWAENEIRKVPISGGAFVKLCDGYHPWGASWGDNDEIVSGMGEFGIWRVSADGGEPQQLIAVAEGEQAHGPQVLPDGEWVLYTLHSARTDWDDSQIVVQSLATDERKPLFTGKDARYLPTGHLVYASGDVLLARPFDLSRMEVTGGAVPVVQGVAGETAWSGAAHFSYSQEGTLAYIPNTNELTGNRALVWVDRQGANQPVTDQLHRYFVARLSPDGERVAVEFTAGYGNDIWILEIEQNILTRLTTQGALNPLYPIWTQDGERVVFSPIRRDTQNDLLSIAADFSAEAEGFLDHEDDAIPMSFSPSGQLAFGENHPTDQRNILVLPADGEPPRYVVRTPYNEQSAMVSPDGRWIAYVSDRSGSDEVYVEPFPDGGQRRQVSDSGGTEPQWAPGGGELFYRNGEQMIAVPVTTEPEFELAGEHEILFEDDSFRKGTYLPGYDIHPDGRRFLMVKELDARGNPQKINIVLNWFGELERLVPTER